jgi:hypothetical protein
VGRLGSGADGYRERRGGGDGKGRSKGAEEPHCVGTLIKKMATKYKPTLKPLSVVEKTSHSRLFLFLVQLK